MGSPGRLRRACSAIGRFFVHPVGRHLVVWGWNAVFLALVFLGLAPTGLLSILVDVWDGMIPVSFALAALLVLLVPPAATALALILLRRDSARLVRFFFGVEAPLFILVLLRLFLVRDLTPGMAYLLLLLGAGCTIFLGDLLRGDRPSRRAWVPHLLLAGDALCLLVGLWVGVMLAFYAVPAIAALVVGFLRFGWVGDMWQGIVHSRGLVVPGVLLGLLFTALSSSLFLALPFVLVYYYAEQWRKRLRAFAGGRRLGLLITVGVIALAVAGFVVANRQPQGRAFAALASPPASDADRRARLADEGTIRDGLRNAYLAPYRYLSSTAQCSHVDDMFHSALYLPRGASGAVQRLYNLLARPALLDGQGDAEEQRRAAELYRGFFDRSVQKGEKDHILSAMEATYSRDGREAGLINEGGRKVHLEAQDLTVVEHGDWAEVEIHESYDNRTPEVQEVLYHFSLPETATVTGLWLGDRDERDKRFAFRVSPRGAAQKVYKAEVQRRADPALLEQIGPRQYRLRAFPIPPRERLREQLGLSPSQPHPAFHLWLTYRVMRHDGAWPLPALAEARNVFWDGATARRERGKALGRVDGWLPPSLAAGRGAPQPHSAVLVDGLAVTATPLAAAIDMPPRGQAYAVVLDRSHSMGRQRDAVTAAWGWLRAELLPGNDVDLYLTSAASRGEPPQRLDEPGAFDPRQVVYYGGQGPGELIEQQIALGAGKRYHAILVLTDEGSLDMARDRGRQEVRDLGAPLWLVHLGGQLAAGYDDTTVETIQRSGGGVATSVQEAVHRLGRASKEPPGFITWADGYLWRLVPAEKAPAPPPDDAGFSAIAARQLVVGRLAMPEVRATLAATPSAPRPVAELDRFHALARAQGFASPYSSLIVLVEERQHQALDAAEKADDRFDRKVETGEKTLDKPLGPLGGDLVGTPEPAEWLLIALAALALLLAARRRRTA